MPGCDVGVKEGSQGRKEVLALGTGKLELLVFQDEERSRCDY